MRVASSLLCLGILACGPSPAPVGPANDAALSADGSVLACDRSVHVEFDPRVTSCSAGSHCARTADSCGGVCTPYVGLGEVCDGSHLCDPSVAGCSDGHCVARLALGQRCEQGLCNLDAFCKGEGDLENEIRTCRAKLPEGSSCYDAVREAVEWDACARGFGCRTAADGLSATCQRLAPVGAACANAADCLSGSCDDATHTCACN